MEAERAAVAVTSSKLPEVGEVLGRDDDPGLLGELAHGAVDGLLAVLEAAAGEAPHVRPDRRVLVALLHQHPPARIDEGHLHEVGADDVGGSVHPVDPSQTSHPHA